MSRLIAEQLRAGILFGDHEADEYIYLPGSEIGMSEPLCVVQRKQEKQDMPLEEAAQLVRQLSLRPVKSILPPDKKPRRR